MGAFYLNDFLFSNFFCYFHSISYLQEATADEDAEFEDEEEQGINENGDGEMELLQHQS